MIKYLIILLTLCTAIAVYAQATDAQNFADGMSEFNSKNYDAAIALFAKIPKGNAHYISAVHMIGACHNMKYSEKAVNASSWSKSDIKAAIGHLETANKYYQEACDGGSKPSCDQKKILEQVIIALKNALK